MKATDVSSQVPERIMLFIHSLHGGGAERVAADLSAHWVAAGREVMVVTQAAADQDVYTLDPRVSRRVLNTAGLSGGGIKGILANLRRVRALRAAMRAFRPDIVVGMMTTASVLAVLAGAGLPCKVVATEHTHPPSQQLPALWQWLRRKTYPRAAQVVALTRGTADWLAQHVPGSRLAVVPNSVRWPLASGQPRLVPPSDAARYLLAVGRLHPDKGFEVLVEAYARIAADFPDWSLIILGEGGERPDLEARIRAAGLESRVHLPGRAGNVADWYHAADLYVLSSRFEGLSNTLLEALASGLPAVSFDCETGPREIVRDGVDGMLVRPDGDPDALAAALRQAMQDDALRHRFAQAAIDVRDRFSVQHVLQLWEAVFAAARRSNRANHE